MAFVDPSVKTSIIKQVERDTQFILHKIPKSTNERTLEEYVFDDGINKQVRTGIRKNLTMKNSTTDGEAMPSKFSQKYLNFRKDEQISITFQPIQLLSQDNSLFFKNL